jgi:hypothetical protein
VRRAAQRRDPCFSSLAPLSLTLIPPSSVLCPFPFRSVALFLTELPWVSIIVFLTLPISYFMFGLRATATAFFWHYIATLVLCVVYISFAHTVAFAAATFEMAQAILGVISPILFLFGGLWSPPAQMAAGVRWFCWIDPVFYSFRSLIPSQFYCDPAVDGPCPIIKVVTSNGLVPIDRYTYVSQKYDLRYEERFESLG